MIYSIFMQYMKHRMQITQERSEYDLMTNSVKFMQQMTYEVTTRCITIRYGRFTCAQKLTRLPA